MSDTKMSEIALTSRSPLQGLAARGRHGRITGSAGVIIREIQNAQIANVIARKGRAPEVAKILSMLAGTEVTDRPARVGSATAVTGIAPGQWLVTRRVQANLATELTSRLASLAAIMDQSHSRIVLELSGPNILETLAKGTPIDLDPSIFKPGHAVQTAASHINIQLALLDGTPTFELITAASTAGSLWSWLTTSSAEFGIDVIAHG